jgi:uncharacterized protein (TIGR02147 family)
MNIFNSNNYVSFLKSYVKNLPKRGRGEINRMAVHLNVHPTLISQVMSGSKDLSLEQAQSLTSYLGLTSLEADYFLLLVQKERAGTHELKKYFVQKIEEMQKNSLQISKRIKEHRQLSDYEKSVFYSSWFYSAMRLYSSVEDGKTVDEIAKRFNKTRTATLEILNFLKEVGLCIEEKGRYKMGTQHTHLESTSPLLKRHHSNWRLKAIEKTEGLSAEELMFTSPFSISKKDFGLLREEVLKLIKTSSQIIKESPAEEVACLNIDMFWL